MMAWAKNRPPAGTPQSLPASLFPADNWWNLKIADAPIDPRSDAYIEHERTTGGHGASRGPSYDWGNNYGLPFCTVSGDHPKVTFSHISYSGGASGDDSRGYPIPLEALTEPGWTEDLAGTISNPVSTGDRHLLVFDVDNKYLYEIYQPFYNATAAPISYRNFTVLPGQWACASCSFWDTTTNSPRPDGVTSSDAAGLQVLPGLVKYDELVGAGPITHAHRLCLYGNTRDVPKHVWPARHDAGSWNAGQVPLGARFRLKASFNINGIPGVGANGRRLLQSLKDYGLIFVDNGGHGQVTGTNDARWGNYESAIRIEMVYTLQAVKWTDLEVVELGWGKPGVIPPQPPPPPAPEPQPPVNPPTPPKEMTMAEALATIARIEAELADLKAKIAAGEAAHAADVKRIADLTAALAQVKTIAASALA